MKDRRVRKSASIGLAGILLITLAVLPGCKKQEEQQASAPVETQAKETASAAEEVVQTVCPVMGGKINKDIFTEYEGKKVYFCCEPCLEKFKESPEQYLAKLPQFN